MVNNFKTVFQLSEAEIIEKKSRFIGVASPVYTEEEAILFIEKKRKEHYNARHNVFAYQIGNNNELKRYSDDGEPAKTAGMPILKILESEDLRNIIVVITRYFGGTLLGTGGLVKAYSESAKQAIKKAIVIEKVLYQKISVTTDYNLSGKVQYETLNSDNIILDTIYSDVVEFIVLTKMPDLNAYKNLIQEVSSATITPKILEQKYIAHVNDEIKIYDI